MAKIRVGQLAKELGIPASEAVSRLRDLGIQVKSNLSTVDDAAAGRLRAAVSGPAAEAGSANVAAKSPAVARPRATRPAAKKAAKKVAAKPQPVGARPRAAQPRPAAAAKPSGTVPSAAKPKAAARPPATAPRPVSRPPAAGTGSPAGQTPLRRPQDAAVRKAPAARPATPPRPVTGTAVKPGATAARPTPSAQRHPVTGARTPVTGGVRPAGAGATRPQVPRGATGVTPGHRPIARTRPGTAPAAPRPAPPPSPHRPAPARHRPAAKPMRPPAARRPAPTPRPAAPSPPPVPEVLKEINITEGVTVKELSEKMERKAKDIITKLIGKGILATINQPLDTQAAVAICREFGFDAKVVTFEEEVAREQALEALPTNLKPRDPVVTIMGHVDHGKTSLLDAIRESKIVAREHGGITQHIGAYHIERKDRGITFIDTPGHEAFTLMRARGARVTDIVVLVIAADDGVMPQTVEAIDHARAASVPIVVAINKVDKPGANLDRVKKQLAEHDLLVEDWGGRIVSVPISAKQKTGIDDLLEMLLLVSDIAELKADPTHFASGTVLESRLDKARGPVATILVQHGTLRIGDPFIAGAVHGKVRAMFDDRGHRVREAAPAIPVEVLGLEGVPQAGDAFQVLEAEWRVRQIGAFRQQRLRQEAMAKSSRLTLDHLHHQIRAGVVKELPLIVKADMQGSVEALTRTLQEMPSDKVKTRVIHAGSGAITETDVLLASASNAIIIGYNVRPERNVQELADMEKVEIRLHSVIYNITSEIKNAMMGLLEPESKEVYLGRAEIRRSFRVPKVGVIAGCQVSDGRVTRSGEARLLRDNVVVYTGKISSLRRFKDDVSEVKAGYECGIGLTNYNDIKVGDVIEVFRVEQVAAKSL